MSGLIALAVLLAVPAHGQSKSFADWLIAGRRAEVRVTFFKHDLDAALVRDPAAHVAEMTRASVRGQPCSVVKSRAAGVGDPPEEIIVVTEFSCPLFAEELEVSAGYLPSVTPAHLTIASFSAGEVSRQHIFTRESPSVRLVLEKERRWPLWVVVASLVSLASLVSFVSFVSLVSLLRRRRVAPPPS